MADIASQKAQLKAIYDQAVAENDIETANAAVDKSAELDKAAQLDLSVYQDASSGLPEAITNMASGMVGKVVGDAAGFGAIPYDYVSKKLGYKGVDPTEVRNNVRNAITYQPKSETGKVVAKYNPMAYLGRGVSDASKWLADVAGGAGASPWQQQLITDITPELVSVLGAKYPISKIPGAKTVGKVASFIPETIANVVRPHYNPRLSAGMLMNKIAGDRQPAILGALDQATESMPKAPGVRQEEGISAGQAAVPAGSAEFSALQKGADSWDSSAAVARDRAQIANRDAILRDVQPSLEDASSHRSSVSSPWYKSADAQHATIDPSLDNLLQSLPSGVMSKAQNTARVAQVPFTQGQRIPATSAWDALTNSFKTAPDVYPTISGWNLQNIKSNASKAASNPALEGTEAGVTSDALQSLKAAIGKRIPDWDVARQTFRDASVPVNQANVLQKARDILNGQGSMPERMTPYMNLTGRGETGFMRSATGYPNAGTIDSVVNPTQMAALDEVGRQMVRDKYFDELSNAGTSRATKIIGDFGKPIDTPTLWDQTATIVKSALGKFENAGRDITMQEVAQIMKDPALSAKVMRAATPQQKALLARIMNAPATGALGTQLSTLPQNQDN